MEEVVILLIVIGLVLLVLPVLTAVALYRLSGQRRRIEALEADVAVLNARLTTVASASRHETAVHETAETPRAAVSPVGPARADAAPARCCKLSELKKLYNRPAIVHKWCAALTM